MRARRREIPLAVGLAAVLMLVALPAASALASAQVRLVNARGDVLVADAILQAGQSTRTFRSRRFRVVLGTNAVRLRINGKARAVPPSSQPIAYEITRRGRRSLPPERRPSCR